MSYQQAEEAEYMADEYEMEDVDDDMDEEFRGREMGGSDSDVDEYDYLASSSSVFSDRKVKFSFWGFSELGFDGSEDSKWRFLWADSYGFGGLNLGLQSGFNVEELSSIPNLRSYNYYSDDQHCGLCHKKKRVNGKNFGLSPPINGCDFLRIESTKQANCRRRESRSQHGSSGLWRWQC